MNSLSLRARLLAGMGLVAAVLLIVAIVITTTTRSQLIAQIDDRLEAAGGRERGEVFDRDAISDVDHRPESDGRPPERQSDLFEGILDADGTLTTFFVPNIGGSVTAPPDLSLDDIDVGQPGATYLTVDAVGDDVDYRVLVDVDEYGNGAFVTGLPLNDVASTINRLMLIELVGVSLILAVLALVTWWMLRHGIGPIKQMTAMATTIAAGDLSARADESSPAAESRELAVALNTMLGTLDTSMQERADSEARLRRFVADASHELRTPVTTIRGYAELYRIGGLADADDLADAMRRTEAESQRMTRLVEDMLTLAKLDEGRPLDRRPVDLVVLAEQIAADARVVSPTRDITVESPDGEVVVAADDDRLRQVFTNLVNNAVTHTADDTAIVIRVGLVGDSATVEVIDAGAGMAVDVVERVTERFYRADPSRSRHRGGSGLGLAIVDSVVAAHGGNVQIASEPGVGTTVSFDLPISAPS